jgi:hypothetical protein
MDVTQRDVILTSRPDHKPGVYLLKSHYHTISTFIVSKLKVREAIRLDELIDDVKAIYLSPHVDLIWVFLQVKSDLAAKKIITVNVVGPNRIQIVALNHVKKSWWVPRFCETALPHNDLPKEFQ